MQWGNQARMPQGRPAQPKKKKKKNSQARKGEGLLYRNSPISFYNSESY